MFVLVPPEWIVKPHDMEAVEGQDVFFPCRVSGVPEPSIIWRKLSGKQVVKKRNTKFDLYFKKTFFCMIGLKNIDQALSNQESGQIHGVWTKLIKTCTSPTIFGQKHF